MLNLGRDQQWKSTACSARKDRGFRVNDAMTKEVLLSQLQIMAGGGLVLTTSQLAKSLAMNPKVISRMRQEGRFPIPHKLIGTKIVYPLGAVASYLLSVEPEKVAAQQPQSKISPERRRVSNVHALVPDMSRKMLSRALVSALEAQQQQINSLVMFFSAKIRAEQLDAELVVNKQNDQSLGYGKL